MLEPPKDLPRRGVRVSSVGRDALFYRGVAHLRPRTLEMPFFISPCSYFAGDRWDAVKESGHLGMLLCKALWGQ